MAKFKDYVYSRPNMEDLKSIFTSQLQTLREATSVEIQNQCIEAINQARNDFETMQVIASVRNSINTTDAFYEDEQAFFDEMGPVYQGLINEYYEALDTSSFNKELRQKWGDQLFDIIALTRKSFSPEIIEDLQQENKLITQYTKLKAGAKIEFDGKVLNLSQMQPYGESKDRDMRIKAQEAVTKFYVDNEGEFDRLYDELVKVRDKMAKKLGFENFVPLAYARLTRSDYDASMVSNYRKQVLENLVPTAVSLRERQAKRLGLPSLKYYDEGLSFNTGNPIPKGTPDWILERASEMYKEMSQETNTFFGFMTENELMDLVSKEGKAGGGYCTYVPNYKAPFIFSNFNGTSGDVDVLTHEAGHAFQCYESRNYELPEYNWPTLEACEIHSMSMEFFAWPWMESFFQEDTDKYKFSHLSGALLFIPYGVSVDEFQHFVYENPNATPEERKTKWREIEKKYLPSKDYEENDFLNRGGFWFRQGHIFSSPFYYIDYTLAQVCAFEFWNKARENKEEAWNDYLRLCQAGGSKSFLKLVDLANLHNPFEDGTIAKIVAPINEWLANIDDSVL